MNTLFNSAFKQTQLVKKDLDTFTTSPITSSPALQGQISASLASLSRTIDDYNSMAKRELIPAKQEKAFERVKNFKREYAEFKAQFDRVKGDRDEAEATQNRTDLMGRRPHTNATPENPYSYTSLQNNNASQTQNSTLFGAPATSSNLRREDVALRERDFTARTHEQLDEFMDRGRLVLENLADQREMLKNTQRRLYTVANTLGISGDTIRMIERRAKQDKWIFWAGVVVFVVFVWLVLHYLG